MCRPASVKSTTLTRARSGCAQRQRRLRAGVAPELSPSALFRASDKLIASPHIPVQYSSQSLCSLAPASTSWPAEWPHTNSSISPVTPQTVISNPITSPPPSSLFSPPPSSKASSALSAFLVNARSLPAHSDHIATLLLDNAPDLLWITETWLSPSSLPDIVQCLPSGYSILHKDRVSPSPGGGLALLFKDHITCSLLPLAEVTFMEACLLRITISASFNLVILLVYRPPPPDPSFAISFTSLVSELFLQYPQLLLLGDFNVGAFDPSDSHAISLLSCMSDLGFSQLVRSPTHRKGRTLDLIFTSSPMVQLLDPFPVLWTDHCIIPFFISLPAPPITAKPPPVPRRKWNRVDLSRVQSQISSQLSDSTQSTTLSMQQLHDCLTTVADLVAPIQMIAPRNRPSAPWYTPALRELRLLCRQAERKWRLLYSSELRDVYRAKVRTYHQAVFDAKAEYYANRISNSTNSSRELFQVSRELSSLPVPKFPFISQAACDGLANFFLDKINKIRYNITSSAVPPLPPDNNPIVPTSPPSPLGPNSATWSSFPSFSSDLILQAIRRLKSASPLDPIPLATIQELAPSLLQPITIAVNNCFSTGFIPSDLKHALVVPLLKKLSLDPAIYANYRPISLLSFLMKLLESLATPLLRDFLEDHHILDSFQSGFRPRMGTETVLVSVLDDLARIRDCGGVGALILLDLSAAFDTIDHATLISRIRDAGISGTALDWFRSFLSGRSLSLSLPPFRSTSLPLSCGVPQGSALSPLLFNLYIRPLAELIHSHGFRFYSYADDTQLLLRLDLHTADTATRLRACLIAIGEWMNTNWLKLNGDKTELLVVGPPDSDTLWDSSFWPPSFGPLPKPLAVVKNLGFRIKADLSCATQVSHICSSGYLKLKILKKILRFIPSQSRKTIVTATIMGSLDYCNALFLAQPGFLLQRLQVLQNSAARLILGISRRAHISEGLRSLHWLPIASRVKFKALCLVHRAFYKQGPQFLQDKFQRYHPGRSLHSESSLLLVVPRYTRERSGGRAFSVVAARLWNSLPIALKAISSIVAFRRALKTYLF